MQIVHIFQNPIAELVAAGGMEDGQLRRLFVVDVNRLYQQKNEAASSIIQRLDVQTRCAQLFTVLQNLIRCLHQ